MKLQKLENLNQLQSQPNLCEAEAFWRQLLRGFTAPTPLVVAEDLKADNSQNESEFKEQEYRLAIATYSSLQFLAQQHQLTLHTLLQGAWAILLSRYSGETDVVFGDTVNSHLLPVRVNVSPDKLLLPWLKEIQNRWTSLEKYPSTPLAKIQDWSELHPETPLFESLFVFENNLDGIKLYPLTLIANVDSEYLKIKYDARRFGDATIARILGHIKSLLEGMVANQEQRLVDLPLLTPQEKHQLLVEWNQTETDFPVDVTIPQLFEEQVKRDPDAIAVIFKDKQLTYRELNAKANKVAHYLQKLGIAPEVIVGICVERSLEMVIGLLGILKAGGAYVPLDPAYPQDRLAFMLQDTQVSVLLTQQHLIDILPQHKAQIVKLDTDWKEIDKNSAENPTLPAVSDNLAYVIYTSGSTGQPKGVMVDHKAICQQLLWRKTTFNLATADRILQTIPLAFDPSVWQIFGTLIASSTLVVAPGGAHQDSSEIARLVAKYQVTILDFVPSMLKVFLSESSLENCTSLRHVFCGGEALPANLIEHFKTRLSATLSNQYGPTEACIDTSFWKSDIGVCNRQIVPIGRPITNKQVYILDSNLQPVPIGVPGELHVGGGLARGYLNRSELTEEKFIPNPFSKDPEARLYKTGDLVRYLPDGNIEFISRIDHQVKVRGYRIEIGEIEAAIAQHPAVQEAIAIVWNDAADNKRLVAYVIPMQSGKLVSELRSFLKQQLPDYMVPSAFVMLDALPLLPNGKVNRRVLPEPDWSLNREETFVAPRNPIEQILADICAEVIGVERVGIYDNFFELGGHSLLATQVVSRVSDSFGVELSVRHLFENPTVAALSAVIQKDVNSDRQKITTHSNRISRQRETDSIPVSFAQTRLWFLDQLQPGNPVYNETTTIRLAGSLNIAALEESINEIVRRHEALRTTFVLVDGQPVQKITPNLTITLHIQDLPFPESERQFQAQQFAIQEAKQPFNLASGPLLRATLLRLSESSHWLLLTMHHIVCDAWSMGIFFREMAALYEAFLTGKPSPFSELSIQYADFSTWQRQWLEGEVLQSQLSYWKQQLSGSIPALQLPTDRPRPLVQTYEGASQSLLLSEKLTEALKTLSHQQGVSLFMTLLAAFKTLLYRYCGQQDIILGTPIAGRNRIETENLIGFFLNSLVLRTNLGGNPTFWELLDRVRGVTLEAYAHQDLPFEKLVEELQPERDLSRNPLFDVMVNFINTPARNLTLPGLTLSFPDRTQPESKFSMTLYAEERGDRLRLELVYQRELFDGDRITCLLNQLQFLLEQIVANPNQSIDSYSLVTAESTALLPDPSAVLPQPSYESVTNTFMSWASTAPDSVAICQGDRTWTYRQLAESAQTLARTLLAIENEDREVVAVSGPKSFGLIASMMGVLLSGKVLLTIDRNLPKGRQQLMLEQAKAECLLYVGDWRTSDEWLGETLPIIPVTPQEGQAIPPSILALEAINLPQINPDDPAYIFFTSGTTGIPKGVLGRHKGLSHFLTWQRQTFNIGPKDRTAQLTGLSFDVVLRDIFLPLTSGATLCLPEESDDLTPAKILPWLDRQKITLLHTVPSLAQSWLADIPEKVSLHTLRRVFFAGEPLTETLIRQWRKAFPEAGEIINLYGPTETTLAKCFYRVPADVLPGVQPVGKPIPETQALVLGANNQLCGIGEAGQIVIRTFFRSLGYINAEEENQRRFVKNPFCDDPEDLLYYTGDRGRYRPDGSLEILGRLDHQVKIRGVRIEPGEIEAALSQHPGVRQTVVLAQEDVPGDKRLVAYIVPHQQQMATDELRRHLLQQLPSYMVPSAFIILEALPLTANGKVDRKALPAPDAILAQPEKTFVAPRDRLEIELTKIWEEALHIHPISIRDNFFDLGGHSLLAARMFTQIQNKFGKTLPLVTLFQAPTVEQLASILRQQEWSAPFGSLVAIQPNGSKPPLFCVHEVRGGVLHYRDLANHLDPDRPLYGLQSHGWDGKLASGVSFEEMATHYIKEIRRIQPQGPYFLVGHSAGGKIAFEMAQQLIAQGEKVALLALLDTFGPGYFKPQPVQKKFQGHWEKLLQLGPAYILKRVKRRIKWTGAGIQEKQKKITRKLITQFYLRLGRPLPPTLQLQVVREINKQASRSYVAKVYPGRVTLFRASDRYQEEVEYYRRDPLMGWGNLVEGGWEIYDVPGDHGSIHNSILKEPNVQVLAEKLRACIDRAQAEASANFAPPSPQQASQKESPTPEAKLLPRDELEIQLTKIWEEVLGVQAIGVRDNFFTLGGHSLLALRLFAQIEKKFGKNLPVASIFEASTVEQQAKLLRSAGWSPSWSSLVALQPSGSKPPLFCIHAIGMSVLYYRDLALHLDSDRPFYALQAQGLDGKQAPITRLEDMAAHYIKEIKTIQPEGPYFLGGSSFGGRVAWEMAQQLRAQGEKVGMLALFDSTGPEYLKRVPLSQRISRYLDSLLQLEPIYIFNQLKAKRKWLKNRLKEITQKLTRKHNKYNQDVGRPLPHTQRKSVIEEANKQAARNYTLQVYPGLVTYFRAIHRAVPEGWEVDPQMGWGKLAGGGLEIHYVPGNHDSIFREPHVRVLAEKLRACLEKVEAENE